MSESREVLLETRRFTVVRHALQAASGRTIERESVQHPGAVTILPLLDDQRICLIRNYRVAVGQTLLELPAGTLDPGEDPTDTARRELKEETGYQCQTLTRLLEFFMSPGILNERMVLFVASGLTPGPPDLEEGEEIETLVVPWNEALAMADAGGIRDAKTLVALYYYDRLRTAGPGAPGQIRNPKSEI